MFLSEFHREGPAEGWTFFTFEASADGHIDLFTRLAGGSPVSAAGGVGLGGGVVFRSRVIWDADGKPVRWTLIEEVRSGWQFLLGQGNSNAPGRPGDFVEGSFRDVTITEYNLDLTDEENLEAFNDAFWTVPGQFAYPRIPPNIDPLVERLEGDAVQVGLEYRERTVDAAGLGVGSGAAAFRGDVMVVHRELQSATYLDHQWENPTPAVFTSCYSERDIFGPPAGDTGI